MPGELARESTSVLDRAARPSPRHRLWHVCVAHPFVGDGPCGPSCRAFCGAPWRDGAHNVSESAVAGPDVCVVCDQLSESALYG